MTWPNLTVWSCKQSGRGSSPAHTLKGKDTMDNKTAKVWGFNCFGVAVVLIAPERVDIWNEKHPNIADKITDIKPCEW